MYSIMQAFNIAHDNFRDWHKNIRIYMTFALAFTLCYLLSNKAVAFSNEHGTTLQLFEAFIWTFGDSNSILLASLLLIMLFSDMPFLGSQAPYYLIRTNRKIWLAGQALYIVMATTIYMLFILFATAALCASNAFFANMWSPTAAMLGYSKAGEVIAIPSMVKTLEMSLPFECTGTIFLLMLLYTMLMVFVMLLFNILKGQFWGIISVLAFSLYGFLLNPLTFKSLFNLSAMQTYQANVAVGWMSPLNHATYHMHNFGYDLLPRIWHTIVIYLILIVICYIFTQAAIRRYNYNFSSAEG